MKAFHLSIAAMFLFICIGENIANAHNPKIDSLVTRIKNGNEDTAKVNELCQLTREYQYVGEIEAGMNSGIQAVTLAEKLNFKKGLAQANNNLGNIYRVLGEYDKALDCYSIALEISKQLNDTKGVATRMGNIGIVYDLLGDYSKAQGNYLNALEKFELIHDTIGISRQVGNLGTVYNKMGEYSKALLYYVEAQKMYIEHNQKRDMAINLENIGSVYKKQGELSKALEQFTKALKISEELGAKNLIETDLANLGNIYAEQNQQAKALDCFFKALSIANEIGDRYGTAKRLNQIGGVYSAQGEYSKALSFLYKGLNVSDSIKSLEDEQESLECLSELYETATTTLIDTIGGKLLTKEQMRVRAMYFYKKSILVRDEVFSQENKKHLIQKEMNYEFQKREAAEKLADEKKQAIAQEQAHKQKIITISITTVGFLILLFAGFIFRSLRIARKQRDLIETQKNEVMQQKVIVEKQKHLVEEHRKEIIDSITYAKRIQTALLTSDDYIKKHLPGEYFILFKPKDIVSGDFYWAFRAPSANGEKAKGLFYMATADCTGHGVPGAFMSMLNISYFNENVVERNVRVPNEILNEQREEILKALNPSESKVVSKDGMDCVMCAYDFDKMELHFAAANNPLWLVRNNELIEYKADKMPVGKHSEDTYASFTLQSIALQKDDIIYTSSDGYADQFSGDNKKMMKKRFKAELLKIHQQPMAQQKEHLDKFFMDWKGEAEQIDDVCVIGVRI